MKSFLLAALLFVSSFSFASTPSSLPPTYVFPNNFPGQTDYGYEYKSNSSSGVSIQVQKETSTGKVLSSAGFLSIEGQAAQAMYEQMTSPLKNEPVPLGNGDKKTGKDYWCARYDYSNGQTDYECAFNFSDVRTGALSPAP